MSDKKHEKLYIIIAKLQINVAFIRNNYKNVKKNSLFGVFVFLYAI